MRKGPRPKKVEGVDFVRIRVKEGDVVAGRALGFSLDAENHVVWPQPELTTVSQVFGEQWAHSGRATTCRPSRWDIVEGYDRTPCEVDGRRFVPEPTEPTRRWVDEIAFEPEAPIPPRRNQWSLA